jgi:alpha-mannosidase
MNIDVDVDNRTENHRLRLMVHTDLASTDNLSAQPFDLIKRSSIPETPALRCEWTEPNAGLVSVADENRQLSLFNDGIYEYEHLNDDRGTVAVTLMRSTARIANDPMDTGDGRAPDSLWDAPENQCLREVSYRLAIRPGKAAAAQLLREMQCFQVPMLPVFDAVDSRKFSGGRPFNGDLSLHQHWHRLPKAGELVLPLRREGLTLDSSMVFSALKKSHDRTAWIIRFFNPAEAGSAVENPVPGAAKSGLDEYDGGDAWNGPESVGGKKIVTLRFHKLYGSEDDAEDALSAQTDSAEVEVLV